MRMRSTSVGRACAPATMRAGSDGKTASTKKVIVTTAHTTKMAHANRPRKYFIGLSFGLVNHEARAHDGRSVVRFRRASRMTARRSRIAWKLCRLRDRASYFGY